MKQDRTKFECHKRKMKKDISALCEHNGNDSCNVLCHCIYIYISCMKYTSAAINVKHYYIHQTPCSNIQIIYVQCVCYYYIKTYTRK